MQVAGVSASSNAVVNTTSISVGFLSSFSALPSVSFSGVPATGRGVLVDDASGIRRNKHTQINESCAHAFPINIHVEQTQVVPFISELLDFLAEKVSSVFILSALGLRPLDRGEVSGASADKVSGSSALLPLGTLCLGGLVGGPAGKRPQHGQCAPLACTEHLKTDRQFEVGTDEM